ncbi:hypothetical protein ACJX0J_040470 [Zea mays]
MQEFLHLPFRLGKANIKLENNYLHNNGVQLYQEKSGKYICFFQERFVNQFQVGKFSQDDDLQNSLIASKELVKVLAHIWGPGELNPSSVSLISALRSELDVARSHSNPYEIEDLKKQLAEEMESWKNFKVLYENVHLIFLSSFD